MLPRIEHCYQITVIVSYSGLSVPTIGTVVMLYSSEKINNL